MPTYNKNSPIAKAGVNYFRTIFEDNSLFHKIEQENDLGIDATVEFINNGQPTHINIAVQIKSGNSYYDSKRKICKIHVEDHFEYWKNYPLPVYGLVFVPALKKGYWVNITQSINSSEKCSLIQFSADEYSLFDLSQYHKLFFPLINNEYPAIDLSEAKRYFLSDHDKLRPVGSKVLFRCFVNEQETWKLFLDYIEDDKINEIPNSLLYYVAHIPWHPDIFYHGESISDEVKNYCKKRIGKYDDRLIIKLLSNIDKAGIQRGSIGQSIEAIISIVEDKKEKLYSIISDSKQIDGIRIFASMIYAVYFPEDSMKDLEELKNFDVINDIIGFIEEYGHFELYI
jgi:hypothetical protein